MMTHYLQMLRRFNRDLRLFLIGNACIGFAYFGIYSLLLNLYLLRLGYGPEFIGLINGAGALLFAFGCLPAGVLSRRWGSRRALMAGYSLTVIGYGLLPLAEFMPTAGRTGWLLTTYMLSWLGGALFVVNFAPFLMATTGEQERNHAFAVQGAVIPLAGFAGNLVGGLLPGVFATLLGITLDQPAPYRYTLWLAALLLLPAVLATWATRPVDFQPTQEEVAADGAAPYTLILVLALIMLLRAAGEWGMRIFFNVYLDAGLQVSTALIGALAAMGQLLGVIALTAPLVMGRWGKVRTIGWGLIGMAGMFLPLILIAHWVAVGLGFIGMMAVAGLTNPAFNLFSQECVPPRWRTTVSGAMNMALGVSIAGMALGGGQLIAAVGYRPLFVLAAILPLIGALLFFVYFRRPVGVLVRPPAVEAASEVG